VGLGEAGAHRKVQEKWERRVVEYPPLAVVLMVASVWPEVVRGDGSRESAGEPWWLG
jgi:hypothetical protein